jgi:hypothetical protein
MNLLDLNLPKIKSSNYLKNDENETTFVKLKHVYKAQNSKLINISKNLRTINCNNYRSKNENNTKLESNEINNSIKSLLQKNISIRPSLRPLINVKQSCSKRNYLKMQKLTPSKDHIFIKRNPNEVNNMSNFINKLNKLFIAKSRSHIKVVNDISKKLLKENEEDTHGNKLYNDTEEEKKDSIVYYLDKNNVKKMIKTKLTKKIQLRKNLINIQPYKNLENIRIKISKFTSLGYGNIKRIKFLENFAQEKLRNNITPNNMNKLCINQSKRNKLKFIIKKKLKKIGHEMNDNQNYMQIIKNHIESSIDNARRQIDFFSNEIEKEMNS